MRVLLTGHKGYIGTVMAPMLKSEGMEVTGLESDLYRNCTYGEGPEKIKTIFMDIRDIKTSDLEGYDAVVHLAALSNDPLGDLNPSLTYDINQHASVRLAKCAKEAGVRRYLFSSSCSLYGAAGSDKMTEGAKFNPVTPYGESKVRVEQEVRQFADENFSPVFLRNTTAYGVSPRLRFDIVLNNLVAWAYTTKKIFLKSDGSPWRPLVHIEDISRAFVVILKAPKEKIHNQAFNVGLNEENYQIKDLAEIVKSVVPDCSIEYAKDASPDKRSYQVDFSKLHNTFPKFKPKWNVTKGAKELYNTYKKYGLKLKEFEGPKYKRIDQIKLQIQLGNLSHELRWIN